MDSCVCFSIFTSPWQNVINRNETSVFTQLLYNFEALYESISISMLWYQLLFILYKYLITLITSYFADYMLYQSQSSSFKMTLFY